jgi:membrane protein
LQTVFVTRWSAFKDLVRSIAREVEQDHIALVAGGVAFFGFLAMFPMFAAVIAIYGLVFDAHEVEQQMTQLDGMMPSEAHTLLSNQLARLAETAPTSLSLGMVAALLFALWSASKGSRGVIKAINVAYDESETRGMLKLNLVSLLLTGGSIVFFMIAIALAAGVPGVMSWLGIDASSRAAWIAYARWPVLLLVVLVAVSALYAIAPDRDKSRRRRFFTPGSLVASVGLVLASACFSAYVSRFGDYNEVYGSLGAVAVFMLWLYIASFVVLVGAEVDAELQQSTSAVYGIRQGQRGHGGAEPLTGSRS